MMYAEKSFKNLLVWQKSIELVADVYEIINNLPESEKFGLASQANRSAVSVPSNIAEGQKRESQQELRRFISIARGSAAELETQLIIINKIFNVDTSAILTDLEQIQKMLTKLHQSLKP